MLRTFLHSALRRTDLLAAKLQFSGFVIAFVLFCTSCGSLTQQGPAPAQAVGEPTKFVETALTDADTSGAPENQAAPQEGDASFAADGSAGTGEVDDQTAAEQTNETATNLQVIDAGDPANLPVFRQAISDKDPTMREAAIQALAGQGPAALDLLREAYQDSDPAVRLMVIENIGSIPEALGILQEAIGDVDVSVRQAAQRALDFQANSVALPAPEAGPEPLQVPGDHP
jgi:hypothetical protein